MSAEPVLTGISSMATRGLLADLAALYERQTRQRVAIESVGGVEAAKRVESGEAFDVVVLASDAMARLADAGHIARDSLVDVVRSSIAVAVKDGTAAPDISSESALREAILRAKTIGYSTGPSGAHVLKLLERWGIAPREPRVVQAKPGVPVGSLIADGNVEIGFQQLSELMHVEGIAMLGTLPSSIASVTVFSAAITTTCPNRDVAAAFLAFIASDQAASLARRHGMESVSAKP
ncbi:substrate-binding domain-containing protein [Paraburkholderia sp. SARCC-3016]|uniref:substrate-binding domain-containing protein n=1 Tax=Paraburkholderia sp. SARCC-3016 TaxID=3058611 RepID=UPI0028083A1A|nr:substrate-binding domain-containing protein [Paraburkholderia sp. SARCC-3016]MDQ7981713.1 substrate-binding domain-containing protein [Paraburkholderia sp. SARCC-3016]